MPALSPAAAEAAAAIVEAQTTRAAAAMADDNIGRAQVGPDVGDDASAAAMANLAAAAAMPI